MKLVMMHNTGVGDILWGEPIVRHFLSLQEEVALFTPYSFLFDHCPLKGLHLNNTELLFPLPDQPRILQYLEKPHMHILECYRLQADIPTMELSVPRLYFSEEEKQRKIEKPYAVVHVDMNWANYRNAYGVDWEKMISYVQDQGLEVVQISRTGKNLIAPWVQTKHFREVMSILYHAELFIGLDSGPSHFASALQIPSVIFFGSVNPAYRHLDNHKKVFMQSPCVYAHCFHQESPYDSIFKTNDVSCRLVPQTGQPPCCIHDTARVIEAIRSLLDHNQLGER